MSVSVCRCVTMFAHRWIRLGFRSRHEKRTHDHLCFVYCDANNNEFDKKTEIVTQQALTMKAALHAYFDGG